MLTVHHKCIGYVLHPIILFRQGFSLKCIPSVLSFQKRPCCFGLYFLFLKYHRDSIQHRKGKIGKQKPTTKEKDNDKLFLTFL